MTSSTEEFRAYLALVGMMTGGTIAAIVPALNILFQSIPVPQGSEGTFGALGSVSAGFAVAWIYAARGVLWQKANAAIVGLYDAKKSLEDRMRSTDPMNIDVIRRLSQEREEAVLKIRWAQHAVGLSLLACSLILFFIGAFALFGYLAIYPNSNNTFLGILYVSGFSCVAGAFAMAAVVEYSRAKPQLVAGYSRE
jgi:hypothetical protein